MFSTPFPTRDPGRKGAVTASQLAAFLEDLDLYGARLSDWPREKRQEADTALLGSQECRDALEDAKLVETVLTARTTLPPDNRIAERIIAAQKSIDTLAGGGMSLHFFPTLQAAAIVGIALVGLLCGRLVTLDSNYDAAGTTILFSDSFYL